MSGEAIAIAESFLAELRAGEQQINEINARMNQVRAKTDELRARASEGMEQIKERVRQLISHVDTRTSDVGGRFDTLEGEVRALGEMIENTLRDFMGEQDSTRGVMTSFVGAIDTGRGELTRRKDQLVSEVETFVNFTTETMSTLTDEDTNATQVYHAEVLQTKETRKSAMEQMSQQKESRLQDQMQQYASQRLRDFEGHVRDVSERVRQTMENSSSTLDTRFQEQVSSFSQRDQDRRQRLSQETQSLSGALRSLGQNMDTLTTTVVEGGENVNDLMQGTSVGIRTVIGIFENMIQIMDEILAEA